MFENLFGSPKEQRTQLHFRDDGTFEFRKLDIEETFLVEKDKNGEIVKGWKHFYNNQFPFAGYKGIKADQVTMSFDRDIILDPYGLIETDKDNPNKSQKILNDAAVRSKQGNGVGIKAWLADIGEARRLKMMANRAKTSNYNRIILFLGIALIFELLIISLEVLMKR